METKEKLNRESLIQHLKTLNDQNDEFLQRYVYAILKYGPVFQFEEDPVDEFIYLPYFGQDEKLIRKLFEKFIELKYPGFHLTANIKSMIEKLIFVAIGKAERQGIIIYGPVGSGKSTLLYLWIEFRLKVLAPGGMTSHELKYPFRVNKFSHAIFSSYDLRRKFEEEKFSFADDIADKEIMFVDDFGLGALLNHFGNPVNTLEELIYNRYEHFKRLKNLEFYASSNMTPEVVKEKFNLRAFSRLWEMASWELLSGDDKRKDVDILKLWPNFKKISGPQLDRPNRW